VVSNNLSELYGHRCYYSDDDACEWWQWHYTEGDNGIISSFHIYACCFPAMMWGKLCLLLLCHFLSSDRMDTFLNQLFQFIWIPRQTLLASYRMSCCPTASKVSKQSIWVCSQPHCYGKSHAVSWDHAPATRQRWHSHLYPQPIKAGTRFSDPRGMQGWVDLVGCNGWLHTEVVYLPEDGHPSQH